MEKEEIISSGLLEMYVLGVANSEECAIVEQLSFTDASVKEEILAIEQSMEAYAFANAVAPSTNVKNKLFSQLQLNNTIYNSKVIEFNTKTNNSNSQNIGNNKAWYTYAAAAAAILIITSSAFNYFFYNKNKQLIAANIEIEQQLQLASTQTETLNKNLNIVRSKYTEPVSLKGLEAAPDAAAKIFWVKNTNEVYVDASNLPIAPSGKQYQLWAIVDGKPVSAGMITDKDGNKYSIQKMKSFGKAEAFAITLEDEGGHEQPKGTMYVLGKI